MTNLAFADGTGTGTNTLIPRDVERRAHRRLTLQRAGELLLPWDKSIIKVRTLDISLGGVGIVSEVSLPIRRRMLCRINLLNDDGGDETYGIEVEAVNCVFSGQHNGFKVGLVYRVINERLIDAILRMP